MTQNYESLDMDQQGSPLRESKDSLRPSKYSPTKVTRFQVFINFALFACCMASLLFYISLQMEVSNLSGQDNTLRARLQKIQHKKQRILSEGRFSFGDSQFIQKEYQILFSPY